VVLRNRVVHGGAKPSLDELGRGIQKKFLEHRSLLVKESSKIIQVIPNDVHWVGPKRGRLKLNCDATINSTSSALAVVARDWRGNLVFAFSKRVDTNIPIQVETEALLQAASIASRYRILAVCLESDCQVCIQGLNSYGTVIPWRIANLLEEIKGIISSLSSVSFS
jgi:hypothetical protein